MNINKITIAGNLTRDPELKALPSGMTVCNFSIATNIQYKDTDGQYKDNVQYHNIVFFGKQADLLAKNIKKGGRLYVEGALKTSSWEKDGQKHYKTEVIGEKFQFIDYRKKEEAQEEYTLSDILTEEPTDDIPF